MRLVFRTVVQLSTPVNRLLPSLGQVTFGMRVLALGPDSEHKDHLSEKGCHCTLEGATLPAACSRLQTHAPSKEVEVHQMWSGSP